MKQSQVDRAAKDPAMEQWISKLNQEEKKLWPWERVEGMENLTRIEQQNVVKAVKKAMRSNWFVVLLIVLPSMATWYLMVTVFLPAIQPGPVWEAAVWTFSGWVVMFPLEILIRRHFLKVELRKSIKRS